MWKLHSHLDCAAGRRVRERPAPRALVHREYQGGPRSSKVKFSCEPLPRVGNRPVSNSAAGTAESIPYRECVGEPSGELSAGPVTGCPNPLSRSRLGSIRSLDGLSCQARRPPSLRIATSAPLGRECGRDPPDPRQARERLRKSHLLAQRTLSGRCCRHYSKLCRRGLSGQWQLPIRPFAVRPSGRG